MNKKLLVVIDMQNDFITGPLGNEECRKIVPNVVNKTESVFKNNAADIAYTLDTHKTNYLETQEGKNLPVIHCIENTHGWMLIPELQKIQAEKSFCKPTFGSIELAEWIKENEYTEVELVGVCTDICVISNAFVIKAVNPEVKIIVDAACCAGLTPEKHKAALDVMQSCQVNVIGA